MTLNLSKKIILLIIPLFFSGCSYFIDAFLDPTYEVVDFDGKDIGLFFSHNVNGETHPCGCRHFPLGGLPQVAGAIEKNKDKEKVIYIDSGDTFFSSPSVPKNLEESITFNARKLAKGFNKVGLKYWTPGDQDFAKGLNFIKEITQLNGINIILSNLKDGKTLPHKEIVLFESGPHKIFLTGVIHPMVLGKNYKDLFKDPMESLKGTMVKLKEKGFDPKSPFHRLVLISHSGISLDEQIAKNFPDIDWIIGAHTMNFLRFPQDEGKTKLVQVLSRNHYLGHITFSSKGDKSKDKYEIIEVRDELKDELKPNPMLAFIDKHKEEMAKIQESEQARSMESNIGLVRYATNNSCVDCHSAQNEFWQGTAHSVAYQSLVTAKEQNNLACVKCHSLGLGEKRGFSSVLDMIEFDKAPAFEKVDPSKADEHRKNYWSELGKAFGKVGSIREMAPTERRKLASIWAKHDTKFNVTRNFANVQCLNCHQKAVDHPFEENKEAVNVALRKQQMEDKCLTCHDPDQSPEWYQKSDKGQIGPVHREKLEEAFKKVSCPAIAK